MWTYLWALYSVTLTYVSVSLPVPLSPDDYSFIVSPNSERLIHPISFLIFKFMLAILVPLPFQINFRISIPILTKKNPAWILLELHYNLQVSSRRIGILSCRVSSNLWTKYVYLYRSSSIFSTMSCSFRFLSFILISISSFPTVWDF